MWNYFFTLIIIYLINIKYFKIICYIFSYTFIKVKLHLSLIILPLHSHVQLNYIYIKPTRTKTWREIKHNWPSSQQGQPQPTTCPYNLQASMTKIVVIDQDRDPTYPSNTMYTQNQNLVTPKEHRWAPTY